MDKDTLITGLEVGNCLGASDSHPINIHCIQTEHNPSCFVHVRACTCVQASTCKAKKSKLK